MLDRNAQLIKISSSEDKKNLEVLYRKYWKLTYKIASLILSLSVAEIFKATVRSRQSAVRRYSAADRGRWTADN